MHAYKISEEHKAILTGILSANGSRQPQPEKQTPSIYIAGCSDSRFHITDLVGTPHNAVFKTSTAGNQTIACAGSAAYAIGHLPIKLVLVVGHIGCGAVNAAYNAACMELTHNASATIDEAISLTLAQLVSEKRQWLRTHHHAAVDEELFPITSLFRNSRHLIGEDEVPYLPKYAEANVHFQIEALLRLDIVSEKVRKGELAVAGAIYNFSKEWTKAPIGAYLVNVNGKIINAAEGL